MIFLMFARKVLGGLFSTKCLIKRLFHIDIYIDFEPYVYFKTKQNLCLNELALNAWHIVLHISFISC